MMRIASVLLVAVLLSTCIISGTFAKYTTEVSGTSSARVAKWEFTIGDDEINATTVESFTFNLFESVSDENVKTGDGENIIAPGTEGSFDIVLTNLSEVTANYAIVFNAELAGVPLQFSTDNATWETEITNLNIDASEATELAMEDGTATVTVYWQWAFYVDDAGDVTDTALGFDGTAEPSVTATVTLTQVD